MGREKRDTHKVNRTTTDHMECLVCKISILIFSPLFAVFMSEFKANMGCSMWPEHRRTVSVDTERQQRKKNGSKQRWLFWLSTKDRPHSKRVAVLAARPNSDLDRLRAEPETALKWGGEGTEIFFFVCRKKHVEMNGMSSRKKCCNEQPDKSQNNGKRSDRQ